MDDSQKLRNAGKMLGDIDRLGERTIGMRNAETAKVARACGITVEEAGPEKQNPVIERIKAVADESRSDAEYAAKKDIDPYLQTR